MTPVGTIEIKQNSCTNLVEQGTAGEGRLASMLHSASAPDLRGQSVCSSGVVFQIHARSGKDCIAAWLRMAVAICAYHLAGAAP